MKHLFLFFSILMFCKVSEASDWIDMSIGGSDPRILTVRIQHQEKSDKWRIKLGDGEWQSCFERYCIDKKDEVFS